MPAFDRQSLFTSLKKTVALYKELREAFKDDKVVFITEMKKIRNDEFLR